MISFARFYSIIYNGYLHWCNHCSFTGIRPNTRCWEGYTSVITTLLVVFAKIV
jgi:hypothetical protein